MSRCAPCAAVLPLQPGNLFPSVRLVGRFLEMNIPLALNAQGAKGSDRGHSAHCAALMLPLPGPICCTHTHGTLLPYGNWPEWFDGRRLGTFSVECNICHRNGFRLLVATKREHNVCPLRCCVVSRTVGLLFVFCSFILPRAAPALEMSDVNTCCVLLLFQTASVCAVVSFFFALFGTHYDLLWLWMYFTTFWSQFSGCVVESFHFNYKATIARTHHVGFVGVLGEKIASLFALYKR